MQNNDHMDAAWNVKWSKYTMSHEIWRVFVVPFIDILIR